MSDFIDPKTIGFERHTVNSCAVRIYANESYGIHGAILSNEGDWVIQKWDSDGKCSIQECNYLDLVPLSRDAGHPVVVEFYDHVVDGIYNGGSVEIPALKNLIGKRVKIVVTEVL